MGQNNDISSDSSPAATPEPSSEPEPLPEPSPEPIPSESSSSRAETPSSSSSEPPQRRNRYGRALITPDEATQNRQRAEQARRNRQATRGSNFAIQPVFSSFYADLVHRLHRRDLPSAPRG